MIWWLIAAAIVIGSGVWKYKEKIPFWPTKFDWIFFVIGSAIMAGIQVYVGFVSVPWALAGTVGFVMITVIALTSSCIAWAIGKCHEVLQKYSQVCPQCDSKEIINEEFTDIFDYGPDGGFQARLATRSVKHICCNCGFKYTGYQNEEDRDAAVKQFLNR